MREGKFESDKFFVAYDSDYVHPVKSGHRFPMEKYSAVVEAIVSLEIVKKAHVFKPELVPLPLVERVHESEYLQRWMQLGLTKSEERKTGFVHNSRLIHRELLITGGTVRCVDYAIENGISFNIAGGTHHAFSDHGEGFCMLNDQAIAAQFLLEKDANARILIVDLDVHQGNGTAQIFEHKQEVFTFSMHGKNNYPLVKTRSDLDIALEDATEDATYLWLLSDNIKRVLSEFKPTFVFYQAGVDVLQTDQLGKLSLSLEGCRKRDAIVLNEVKNNGIPIVGCLGGGYSKSLETIISAHVNTFDLAKKIYF